VVVRAEAQSSDALARRAVLGAGLAAATSLMLPIGGTAPARANQLLSSEWELVSPEFCASIGDLGRTIRSRVPGVGRAAN
jgi:hypothetical protein